MTGPLPAWAPDLKNSLPSKRSAGAGGLAAEAGNQDVHVVRNWLRLFGEDLAVIM